MIDCIREVRKEDRYDYIEEVRKFNPYHDRRGRFASANSATSFTYAPGRSRAHDLAIQREKERHAAASGGAAAIDTAQKNIAGMLKDGATVKLDGLDPQLADGLEKSIGNVLQRYPGVKDAFSGFSTDDPDNHFRDHQSVVACFDPATKMIHLNTKYYGDKAAFEESHKKSLEKEFSPKGTTIDSVVVHEMGHAIDHYVSKKVIPESNYYWGMERISTRIWNNDIKAGQKSGQPVTGKSIREGLSGYAGKSPAEYLAEGFAEYLTSPNPRPMATKIGKRVETYIKKAEKVSDRA